MFPTLSVPSGSDIVPSGPAVVHRSTQPWRHRTVHTLEQCWQKGLNIIQSNKPSPIDHLKDLIQSIIFKNKSAIKQMQKLKRVQSRVTGIWWGPYVCQSRFEWLFLGHIRQAGLCIYYDILLWHQLCYIHNGWRWESKIKKICSVQSSDTLLRVQGWCKLQECSAVGLRCQTGCRTIK